MTGLRLVLHRFRYDLVEFAQNAESRFFTLALPVLMLAILIAILGSHRTIGHTGLPTLTEYYVPAMLVFGIVWASMINLAVTLTVERERGMLKRQRATPAPMWVLVASRMLTCAVLSLLSVAVLLALGAIAYDVHAPASDLPLIAGETIVGSIAFAALGFAMVGFIGSEDGALPVVLGIGLPAFFISGVFIEFNAIPDSLQTVANLLPISHLNAVLTAPFDARKASSGFAGGDLLWVVGWGFAGALIAWWRFGWEPRGI